MEDKFTKKCKEEHYTIVYFDVMKDLQIDFTEYLVLQTMLHFSKRNEYNGGVTKIKNHLKKSRTTITNVIKILIQKEHIIKSENKSKIFNLNYDIKERFETKNGLYAKIYHNHRKELDLIETHYVFLYLVYSLSKNTKNKIALAKKEYMCSHINTSESNYDTIKSELTRKGFLECQLNTTLKLNQTLFEWFENNSVQY